MNFLGFGSSGSWSTGAIILWVILILWSLAWKGLALWKAARNGSPAWFIVLMVLNTVGILDILYIYFLSGPGQKSQS